VNDPTQNLKAKAAKVLERGVLVLPVGTSVVVIECRDEQAQEVRLVAHGEPELVGQAVAEALRKLQEGT